MTHGKLQLEPAPLFSFCSLPCSQRGRQYRTGGAFGAGVRSPLTSWLEVIVVDDGSSDETAQLDDRDGGSGFPGPVV